mgnify:CR=1 FL=1
MPHDSQIQQDSTKLNPHGSSILNINKFQQDKEYYSTINPDPTVVQIQSGLDDSNLTSLATQQLSKNNLWKPTNEYDLQSMEMDRPAMLSSVASQIGLGGLVNFQNTILGRFIGVEPKTPMIEIANSRLVLEFTRRVGSQLAKNLLPTINIGGFLLGKLGLGKEEPLIRPAQEYIITKLPFGERDTAYYVGLFTGFESNENPLDGITENKEILKRTGSGQISLLKQNLEQNIFRPSDTGDGIGGFLSKIINKINKFLSPKFREKEKEETLKFDYNINDYKGTDIKGDGTPLVGQYIGLGDRLLPQQDLANALRFPTEKEVDKIFTDSPDVQGWKEGGDEEKLKRGILRFTQTIVNSGHAVGKRINQDNYGWLDKDGEIISKGPKIIKDETKSLSSKDGDGRSNVFCRSWIKTDQYDTYKKLIRHEKHYLKHDGNLSNLNNFSVLNNVGMPRIHSVFKEGTKSLKPMMFSLENLAWDSGDILALPECERGPNDGRIMWFPPYEIGIDENITANWEKTDFIGRGEPVYTYNNSERSLNFQFKLIMDYPPNLRNNINSVRQDADKFFAGCGEKSIVPKQLSEEEKTNLDVEKKNQSNKLKQPETNLSLKYTGRGKSKSDALKFYFQHSDSETQDSFDPNYNGIPALDVNKDIKKDVSDMVTFLNNDSDAKYFDLILESHTSLVGSDTFNKNLSTSRINAVIKFLEERGDTFKENSIKASEDSNINKIIKTPLGKGGDESKDDKDKEKQIKERFVDAWIEPNFDVHPDTKPVELDPAIKKETSDKLAAIEKQLNEQKPGNFIGGECKYFQELIETDPFVFKSYKEKIKFFHPAFHSQTPDDFNKRLVFLHQCTRQGEPFSNNDAKNSLFGKMPVCVLRIGDFFNCRIIINNIGFSYEPLLWDLNPEGAGVQPMLCNVNINCNVVGGASLDLPITKLQTALSSKFYANHKETTKKELEEFIEQKRLKELINNK